HLGDADADAAERLDQLVLGSGCLLDLGHRAERDMRPRQRQLTDFNRFGRLLADRPGQQRRQDEVITGGQNGGSHALSSRRVRAWAAVDTGSQPRRSSSSTSRMYPSAKGVDT